VFLHTRFSSFFFPLFKHKPALRAHFPPPPYPSVLSLPSPGHSPFFFRLPQFFCHGDAPSPLSNEVYFLLFFSSELFGPKPPHRAAKLPPLPSLLKTPPNLTVPTPSYLYGSIFTNFYKTFFPPPSLLSLLLALSPSQPDPPLSLDPFPE